MQDTDKAVVDWLMDSDPAIRWQVMRDLTDAPADAVAAERAQVATQGWGARLLGLQAVDGQWDALPWSQDWTDTFHTLELLHIFGLDPQSEAARRAVDRVAQNVTWKGGAPVDTPWDNNRFFVGEVEPCINGNVVGIGAYFGQDVDALVERLLGEQMADGGWNCEQENGATVGSFGTTIRVLEGLLDYERKADGPAEVRAARLRGQEYMLERRLFRRKSTGEVIDRDWLKFSFPSWHFYDVLRGLDYLRAAGAQPDERMADAAEVVRGKRGADGRWLLENPHAGKAWFDFGETEGQPSRWNTLRAMRVLEWHAATQR